VIARIRLRCALLGLLIFPGALAAQSDELHSDDLLNRVWEGVQQAQRKYTSSCGTVTETRTSSLMVRPMVLRGKFCAEGTTRFALEYFEPASVRIRYNEDTLNGSLEVDGKSGVNSVFVIAVSSLNPKIPAETFEVYKP
jgi:hypothetical protein